MGIRTRARLSANERTRAIALATASMLGVSAGAAIAADNASGNEELLKKLEMMESRIRTLEGELKKKKSAQPADQASATLRCGPKRCSQKGARNWVGAMVGEFIAKSGGSDAASLRACGHTAKRS